MTYYDFLHQVIEGGIKGAKRDYLNEAHKLEGSLAGFEACRNKLPSVLREVLTNARQATQTSIMLRVPEGKNEYWKMRCYELEVEWVCNVVSVMLLNQGLESIVPPTARGAIRAHEILGRASFE